MKNIIKITLSILILIFVLPTFMVSVDAISTKKAEMRGLWVSTVINIDYPKESTTDPEILKSEALTILDNAKKIGINTIFLQVRPTADAFYKSKIFPWSKYLTGTQGLMPYEDFDPLEFWVTEAHNRGIELHAWINPYRITKKTSEDPKFDYASLDPNNPAIIHPDWVVEYSDGNLYFNPGIPEVRKLIIDGVQEIIDNYGVDGIHFDDYFYPGKDFKDAATFQKYGSGYSNIDDWRRANVNTLISDLSKEIKATGKNIRFGISPFGIWANNSTNPLGSATKGMESYSDHYADSLKWIKSGMLDYIAPQLYWNIGYSVADYSKLLSWWEKAVKGSGVDLYIGQAAYRSGNTSSSSPWYGNSEMEKQLQLNAKSSEIKGSIFFTYSSFLNNPSLSAIVKAVYEQRDGIAAKMPVNISRPLENIKTSFDQFYLNGSSDPDKDLYLNGQPVENRSKLGYFGLLVPLQQGENIFTISQEATSVTRIIYREAISGTTQKMSTAEILKGSTFPEASEYRMPGEKITLSCKAPIGSKVTVKINGKSYIMKPLATTQISSGIYPTTFNYTYTIPAFSGTPRNISLGTPSYTMNYKGKVRTVSANAKVIAIMKKSPFYAEVVSDVIDTYQVPSSVNGAGLELYSGMVDYITGMTGSYIRLSSNQWVKKSSVRTYTSKYQLTPVIKSAVYSTGFKWDTLKLEVSASTAATASFDGVYLKMNISNASLAPLPILQADSLFSTVSIIKIDNILQYTFTLKQNQGIDGYYINKTTKGLTLNVKRKVHVNTEAEPLTGITIMIDPGHGGSETGTYGPLGLDYSEKIINLKTSLKLQSELEKLGATVLMTRTTDKTLSLEARLAASRKAKPDMFISIHANSMEDNVDMTKIDGLSVFYRESLAGSLAENIFNTTKDTLSRNNQGIHARNFYVIRGTWTPSVLFESGFVPNTNEFEWLTDEAEQTNLAKSISQAILNYFEN